ncbi:hypothetical protein ACRAWG_01945 [Methylobacterium sp. P31]
MLKITPSLRGRQVEILLDEGRRDTERRAIHVVDDTRDEEKERDQEPVSFSEHRASSRFFMFF